MDKRYAWQSASKLCSQVYCDLTKHDLFICPLDGLETIKGATGYGKAWLLGYSSCLMESGCVFRS